MRRTRLQVKQTLYGFGTFFKFHLTGFQFHSLLIQSESCAKCLKTQKCKHRKNTLVKYPWNNSMLGKTETWNGAFHRVAQVTFWSLFLSILVSSNSNLVQVGQGVLIGFFSSVFWICLRGFGPVSHHARCSISVSLRRFRAGIRFLDQLAATTSVLSGSPQDWARFLLFSGR